MKQAFISILILSLSAFLFYILYLNGILTINAKRALLYIGKTNLSKATFSSCSGYTKRILRFKENKTYYFMLDNELTNGEITIELLDSMKNPILSLNNNKKSSHIALEKKKKYYLVIHFYSASGHYNLNWN